MSIKIKCVAALLFHNDEDIVLDQLKYYISNSHKIIIFNHNSSDNTHKIICDFITDDKDKNIINYFYLDSNIIFKHNQVHECVSKILLGKDVIYEYIKIYNSGCMIDMKIKDNYVYVDNYDWISFPESDEFLEGPDRSKTFYDHLCDLHYTKYKAVRSLNFVFWFTNIDDENIISPTDRVRHYSFFRNCGPRIYTWRASLTNIRWFGHNLPDMCTTDDLVVWKTRHYDARSKKQFKLKILDRMDVAIGGQNYHYTNRVKNANIPDYGIINPNELHFDDGISELIQDDNYDWNNVY